jgi:hypothetical protein
MSLPVSYFEYKNFTFNEKTFIKYWTRIEEMLFNSYICDEIYQFKYIFENIKQKKFYEFTTPSEESSPLRNVIHDILVEEYKNTPLKIFKDFYSCIKNDLYQGLYGHTITISMPQNKPVLESELNDFCSFYKSVCDLQHNTWPHHFLLNKEAFHKVENIHIKVFFALIAMDCYMIINKECDEVYWGN